jgi:hypothetical protein
MQRAAINPSNVVDWAVPISPPMNFLNIVSRVHIDVRFKNHTNSNDPSITGRRPYFKYIGTNIKEPELGLANDAAGWKGHDSPNPYARLGYVTRVDASV